MSAVQTYTDELRVSGIRSGGFGQLPKAVMLDPDLSAESKAIYAYFASYTGGGNTKAFPGRDKIVHDLAVTKDTYYKHFKPLTDNGYISVAQSNGGAGGKGFSHNIYTLEMFPAKYSAIPGNVSDRQLQALQLILEAGDISAAGYGNIPKAVMTDASLPLAAKAVYAYLCVFSGQDFKAAPSKSVATFHLGMSSNLQIRFFHFPTHAISKPSPCSAQVIMFPSNHFLCPQSTRESSGLNSPFAIALRSSINCVLPLLNVF